MATPVRDVDLPLAAELARLRDALRNARLVDKATLVAVVILVGAALALVKMLPKDGALKSQPEEDPFHRSLRRAPQDDEPTDSVEEEQAAHARTEPSISWEQAKRELAEPDA